MKKLLVLGGVFQHCKVVETAKEKGIKVYVTDYLKDSPAKKKADVALDYDVNDIESIVDYCRQEGMDGVINTSLDSCQLPYLNICDRLKLPCYGGKKQFEILTNKKYFNEYCALYGIDTIDTYSANDIKKFSFPVLVKPTDSRGSRGQTICRSKDEVNEAVKFARMQSPTNSVIIEKYLERAQDFTAAYLFANGNPFLLRTGDRYTGTEENGLNNVAIACSSPSKYTDLYIKNAHSKVINMLKGIGIKNGPVYFQGFIDGEKVRLYDPGYRFSGGEYEKLFLKATGIDLMDILIDFSITGEMKMLDRENYSGLNGMRVFHLDPTIVGGKIQRIEGVDNIKRREYVETVNFRYKEGDLVEECRDVRRRLAEICILTPNKQFELETLRYIQKELKVYSENGENMICNEFNLEQIQT